MTDVVVTVPKGMWEEWLAEGDLPGEESEYENHFWLNGFALLPQVKPSDRVYIVAHGRLRGFSPLVRIERVCTLAPNRSCLIRRGDAEAVTIDEPIRGFQGWRYRWWQREDERPFPEWMVP